MDFFNLIINLFSVLGFSLICKYFVILFRSTFCLKDNSGRVLKVFSLQQFISSLNLQGKCEDDSFVLYCP